MPDISISASGMIKLVDVVITHPNATTTPAASQFRLRAADDAFKGKLRDYARNYIISESSNPALVPFAMESYGALHKASESLLRYIADIAFPGIGSNGEGDTDALRAQFITRARQRVSVACMRGNSIIFNRWYQECVYGSSAGERSRQQQ